MSSTMQAVVKAKSAPGVEIQEVPRPAFGPSDVLVKVEAQGPGVCHEGYESCFFRRLEDGQWAISEKRAYDPAAVYGGKP